MSDFYRISTQAFPASEGKKVYIYLTDIDSVTDNEIELTGAGTPLEFKIIDNSEDSFTVIKSTQAIIRFNSTDQINMATFASGSDQRWAIIISVGELLIDGQVLFVGSVIMNDIREDFMPVPNVVQLTATDGLGLLKDIPLTDFNGNNPRGHYKIIDFIAFCLKKATSFFGSGLQINVAYNIKLTGLESDISTPNTDREHLFDTIYLWAKMFEDEIDTSINCYEALQRILGESAVLFQRNGQWWIVRIEEFTAATEETSEEVTEFGSEEITNGDFTGSATGWTLGTDWTYNTNNVIHTVSTSGAFYQAGALDEGETYQVSMDVGGTVGTVAVFLDGGPTVGSGSPGTTLTFQGVWNTSSGHKIRIVPTSDFDGTIDNVTVKKVTVTTVVTDAANRGFYVTTFDQNGTFIGNLGEKQYFKDIGKDAPYTIFFSKEQTEVTNDRPHKFAKETFNYDLPLEIPDNKDFSRGDLFDDSLGIKSYTIDYWRFYKGIPNVTQDNIAFIRRVFNAYDLEIERYVVIGIAADALYYLESEAIPIGIRDKFEFSVDLRYNDTDIFTSGGLHRVEVAQIRLYGSDGTFWTLHGGTSVDMAPLWVESDSAWSTNNRYFVIEWNDDQDDTEWRTATFWQDADCPAAPVGGYITIILQANTGVSVYETHFSNLTWEYIPYINGSYSKYTGQYNQVTRTTDADDYKAKRDETVYMSDSPKALFKGAMFRLLDIEALDFDGIILTENTDFFSTDHRINLPGDETSLFYKGQQVQIQFTTSNNLLVHILSVTYNSGPNTTDIIVVETLIDEDDASASFYIPRLVLVPTADVESIDAYYDASLFPDGVDSVDRPFGELQIFDVWDQFAEDKRIFEATCQGLDLAVTDVESLPGSAHLLYKWSFRDTSLHTNNRVFYLLTFNQNLRNVGWTGTFREVANSTRPKQYEGKIFKYISK